MKRYIEFEDLIDLYNRTPDENWNGFEESALLYSIMQSYESVLKADEDTQIDYYIKVDEWLEKLSAKQIKDIERALSGRKFNAKYIKTGLDNKFKATRLEEKSEESVENDADDFLDDLESPTRQSDRPRHTSGLLSVFGSLLGKKRKVSRSHSTGEAEDDYFESSDDEFVDNVDSSKEEDDLFEGVDDEFTDSMNPSETEDDGFEQDDEYDNTHIDYHRPPTTPEPGRFASYDEIESARLVNSGFKGSKFSQIGMSVIGFIDLTFKTHIWEDFFEEFKKLNPSDNNFIANSNKLIDETLQWRFGTQAHDIIDRVKKAFGLVFDPNMDEEDVLTQLVGDELRYYQQMALLKTSTKSQHLPGNAQRITIKNNSDDNGLETTFWQLRTSSLPNYAFTQRAFDNSFKIKIGSGKLKGGFVESFLTGNHFMKEAAKVEVCEDVDGYVAYSALKNEITRG